MNCVYLKLSHFFMISVALNNMPDIKPLQIMNPKTMLS